MLHSYPAFLDGYRLAFNSPDLSIVPAFASVLKSSPESRVYGCIYELNLNQYSWLLLTEGVPFIYTIQPIIVQYYLLNGNDKAQIPTNHNLKVKDHMKRVSAFTLLGKSTGKDRRPSRRYMNIIIKGAKEQGLDEYYVKYLESIEVFDS